MTFVKFREIIDFKFEKEKQSFLVLAQHEISFELLLSKHAIRQNECAQLIFSTIISSPFLPFSHVCFNCAKNFLYPFGLLSLLHSFYFIKKDMCDMKERSSQQAKNFVKTEGLF